MLCVNSKIIIMSRVILRMYTICSAVTLGKAKCGLDMMDQTLWLNQHKDNVLFKDDSICSWRPEYEISNSVKQNRFKIQMAGGNTLAMYRAMKS